MKKFLEQLDLLRKNHLYKQFLINLLIITTLFIVRLHLHSQIIQTIFAEFSREYKSENGKEIVEGKIYYLTQMEKLVIKVNHPVKQIMTIKGNETILYYPDTRKAFRITSQIPNSMPFFQLFIGVIKEDYGLTDLGYTFANYKRKGNKLISHWNPPKNLSRFLGEIVLEYVDNKLVYVESKNFKGKIISKAFYKNHISFGSNYFPLEISVTKNTKLHSSVEKIVYKNIKFNSSLPQNIINFKLPPDVKVKEIVW